MRTISHVEIKDYMATHDGIQRICYFGDYDPSYTRTKVMMNGLRANGIDVVECWEGSATPFLLKASRLWRAYRRMKVHDGVVIGFSSTRWLPILVRILTKKPLIWDMGFSVYDNWVFDRKIVHPGSLKAYYHWVLDWLLPHFVDKVIFHSHATIKTYIKMFGLTETRFARIISGADTNIFSPQTRTADGIFRIVYHGKYIPIHGTITLLAVAKFLEDDPAIHFTMIGNGQEKRKTEEIAKKLNLKNIEFIDYLPTEQLPPYIAKANLCTGLLGDVPRLADSIPNKLYEAAAMGRICINADTRGIRECFEDGINVILVNHKNPESIATKIRFLKSHPELLEKMERQALKTFQTTATPVKVGKELLAVIASAKNAHG